MTYIQFEPYGLGGGQYALKFLPLSHSYDEHPFWLMNKIEFIKNIMNKALSAKCKKK